MNQEILFDSYLERLKLLAQTALRSNFSLFWKRVESLREHKEFYFVEIDDDGDKEYYLNPYVCPSYKEGCLWVGERRYFSFEYYFLHQAEEVFDRLLMIDWVGEEEEGEFAHFVQKSLQHYGIDDFDIPFWEQESKRGDSIIYQFEAFEKQLKSIGLYLIFINIFSDEYYPMVVNQTEYEKLNGLKIGCFEVVDYVP